MCTSPEIYKSKAAQSAAGALGSRQRASSAWRSAGEESRPRKSCESAQNASPTTATETTTQSVTSQPFRILRTPMLHYIRPRRGHAPAAPADWALGLWAFGPLGLWAFGPLGLWAFGPLGLWAFGPLGLWAFGPLGLWAFGRRFLAPAGQDAPPTALKTLLFPRLPRSSLASSPPFARILPVHRAICVDECLKQVYNLSVTGENVRLFPFKRLCGGKNQ